jgi:hypothetical protein
MHGIGAVLLVGLMMATVLVLIIGIGLMASGGETNRKYGNKMMVLRVSLQACAIAVLVVLLLMRGHH